MADVFESPSSQPVGTVDRWNRYILPDPITGKKRAWTRITTVAKTLSDTYHLEAWKRRMVVKGMGMREDLQELAQAHHVEDKSALDAVANNAMKAAGSDEGANRGTARHKLLEQHMSGELKLETLSHTATDFINDFSDVVDKHNIKFMRNLTERIVCMPQYGIAGRFDAVAVHDRRPVIFDLKTQKTVDYGHIELAMQLGFYANAKYVWCPDTWDWESFEISRDYALVCHAPFTTNTIEIYSVDLCHSLDLIEKALQVREARKTKGLLTKL